MTGAPSTWLFRHALIRAAAYELQLPTDRAALHAAALHALESLVEGRPPAMGPLAPGSGETHVPHASDALAMELAGHAAQAGDDEQWRQVRVLYLRRAAVYAEQQFQLSLSSFLYSQLSELLHTEARAEALRRAADALRNAGRSLEAEPLLLRALDEFRGCASSAGEGACMTNLALVYFYTGRPELAVSTLEAGMAVLSTAKSDMLMASALATHGMLYATQSEYEKALTSLGEALRIHRSMGDDLHEAKALANLGLTQVAAGRTADAERTYQHGLRLALAQNDLRTQGVITGNLAGLRYETKRYEEAALLYPHAIELHRQAGNLRFQATCRCDFACCLIALGRTDEAKAMWRYGTAALQEIGDTHALKRKFDGMRVACERAGVAPPELPGAP